MHALRRSAGIFSVRVWECCSVCRAGPLRLSLMWKACGRSANMADVRQKISSDCRVLLARFNAAPIYFLRSFKCLWKCGLAAISGGKSAGEWSEWGWRSPGWRLKFSVVSSNNICSFLVCSGTTAAALMPLWIPQLLSQQPNSSSTSLLSMENLNKHKRLEIAPQMADWVMVSHHRDESAKCRPWADYSPTQCHTNVTTRREFQPECRSIWKSSWGIIVQWKAQ